MYLTLASDGGRADILRYQYYKYTLKAAHTVCDIMD